MNTFVKHHPRARAHAPSTTPAVALTAANDTPQAVPLAWWQQGLAQQLVAQQSLWDTWQVWAWIPWNLALSAWQMSALQTPASSAPSGMLFAALNGHALGIDPAQLQRHALSAAL